jgi:hypothetical protein
VSLVLLLALTACVGQRARFNRPSLVEELAEMGRAEQEPTPELRDVVALRLPAPPERAADPDAEAGLGAARLAAVRGDLAAARAAWSLAILEEESGDAWFHRCYVEVAAGAPGAALACAEATRADVDDTKRAAAATLLATLAWERAAHRPMAIERARALERVCERKRAQPDACVDARAVLARAWRGWAEEAKDEEAARAALALEGVLLGMEIEPAAGASWRVSRWDGRAESSSETRVTARAVVVGRGRVAVSARGAPVLAIRVDGRASRVRRGAGEARADFVLRPGPHVVEVDALLGGPGLTVAVSPAARRARVERVERAEGRAGARRVRLRRESDVGGDLAALDGAVARQILLEGGSTGSALEAARGRDALLAAHGDAPAVLALAARGVQLDPRLPEAARRDDARALYDRLRARWPDHVEADWRAVLEAGEVSQQAERDAVRAFTEAHPEDRRGWRRRARLAVRAGLLDEAREAASHLPPPLTYDDLDVHEAVRARTGDLAAAAAAGAQLVARAPNLDDEAAVRAALASDGADVGGAIERLRRVRGARSALDWDVLAHADPAAYRAALAAAVAARPDDLALRLRLASEDPATLAPALERFPLARGLHELAESRGLVDDLPWRAALDEGDAILARPPALPPALQGSPLVFELDARRRLLDGNGASLVIDHLIVLLQTEEAVASFGEISVPIERRLLRARARAPDGAVRVAERPPGVPDLALPQLAVGDRVELLTLTWEPVTAGSVVELKALRGRAPALERRYELTGPRAIIESFEPVGEPERASDGDALTLRFRLAPAPLVVDELHAPAVPASTALVGVTREIDEAAVAATLLAQLEAAAAPHPWLDRAARVIAGEGSAEARLARLFRFVARRVEPADSPVDAVEVLASGRGARTPLLLALARAIDLPVTPIRLGAPLERGEVVGAARWPAPALRLEQAFSSIPVVVDGGDALMGGLPPHADALEVLVLAGPDAGEVRPAPESWRSTRPVLAKVALELQPGPDAAWSGFAALTLPPWAASRLRRALLASDDERRRSAFENALAGTFPGCVVDEVRLQGAEAAGAPLGVGLVFRAPVDPGERVTLRGIFARGVASSVGVSVGLDDYLLPSDRTHPLVVRGLEEELEVSVRAPAGSTFTELPPQGDWRAGPFSLRQRAAVTDGTLRWTRGLTIDAASLEPADWRTLASRVGALAERAEAGVALLAAPGSALTSSLGR